MQRSLKLLCQPGMKKMVFALFMLATFGCNKQDPESSIQLKSDLIFHSVNIISQGAHEGSIQAAATVVGPDLCYKITHFQISNSKGNQFDIYAKGTVPGPGQVCAQAIYRKDTTVSIARPAPGKYVLNFWNPDNQLFKSETVTVN
ncbi:MAG TPA: hypothetical protein VGB56_14270 [Flavisolibacter sp.]